MADLKHLTRAWDVDRFIVLEESKVVAIRFSAFENCTDPNDADNEFFESTMLIDGALTEIAKKVSNFCQIFAVDTTVVPEFNEMFELDPSVEPFAVMFFFKNKHIKVDLGTGNNNKINFVVEPEDLIDIIEAVYIGAKEKNLGLVKSVKRYRQAAITR